jgi:hypothetical protein
LCAGILVPGAVNLAGWLAWFGWCDSGHKGRPAYGYG